MLENQEEFDIQKLKSEYPDFFRETSPGLLEFILSKETSSKITDICLENGVQDEGKIEKAAYQIGLTLLGQTLKENFTVILKKELEVDLETAKKLSDKINKLIFSQTTLPENEKSLPEEKEIMEDEAPEEIPKTFKKDAYKEPLE